MRNFNVALMQIYSYLMDKEFNLEIAEQFCRTAKSNGADLVLFPEMWNVNYEHLINCISTSGDNTERIERILNAYAIDQNSHFFTEFQKLAQKMDMAVGITYLNKENGKFKNTVSVIDRHGKAILTYSKVHTCDFSFESLLTCGEEFYTADLDTKNGIIKIGAMICYDREFPESARVLMLKGAEIILVPNSCPMDDIRISQLKARAFENMTGIAMTNYPGAEYGHSLALDGMAYTENGKARNMFLVEAGEEEGIFMASFNIEKLREYRKNETWGNAHRKVNSYKEILSNVVEKPFSGRKKPYESI